MINMFRALMEKADTMQEYIGAVTRKIETPRKTQKEMTELENTNREVKNAFDRLPGRPGSAGESVSLEGRRQSDFPNGNGAREKQ